MTAYKSSPHCIEVRSCPIEAAFGKLMKCRRRTVRQRGASWQFHESTGYETKPFVIGLLRGAWVGICLGFYIGIFVSVRVSGTPSWGYVQLVATYFMLPIMFLPEVVAGFVRVRKVLRAQAI